MRAEFLDLGSDADLEGIQSNLNLNSNSAVDIWKQLRRRNIKPVSEFRYFGENNNNKNNSINVCYGNTKPIKRRTSYIQNNKTRSCRHEKGFESSSKQVGDNKKNNRSLLSKSSKQWEGLFYTTDDSDEEISSGSSIDTEDLDFDYQDSALYQTLGNDHDFSEYETVRRRRRRHKLDLVSEDIFSNSSSDSENDSSASECSESNLYEPISISIRRE